VPALAASTSRTKRVPASLRCRARITDFFLAVGNRVASHQRCTDPCFAVVNAASSHGFAARAHEISLLS
jgi:hypothetical protein